MLFIPEFISNLYNLPLLVQTVGYTGLAVIIFAETGLFFGFFLPGDSLLVTAGVFAAKGDLNIFLLNALLIAAAIIGDSFGYYFGKKTGKIIFNKQDSLLFSRNRLMRAKRFYDEHGGKAIILARFIPVVRTFAPIVAGALEMPYNKFLMYNATGGILWVTGLTLLGYFVGNIVPDLDKNLFVVIAAVVVISLIPVAYEHWKASRQEQQKL